MMRKALFSISLILISIFGIGQSHLHNDTDQSFLKFIENKGQWHHEIAFKADLPEGHFYAQSDQLTFTFFNPEIYSKLIRLQHDGKWDEMNETGSLPMHQYNVNFIGSNKTPRIIGEKAYPEKRNYIHGNNPHFWGLESKSFEKIRYNELYNGIDLSIFRNGPSIKYEFVISPEADHTQIKLKFEGTDEVYLDKGNLHIRTSVNEVIEKAPYSYQIIEGKLHEIACHFELNNNLLTYALDQWYDHRYPLIIDPQLVFATYSGSTADNWGNTACLDEDGSLYTGGTVFQYRRSDESGTGAGQFPISVGAFQTNFQGGDTDIGILKFDSSGTFLQYATYIGGNGAEIPTSTIIDERTGELLILGTTGSSNFPLGASPVFQSQFGGGNFTEPVGGYQFQNGTDIIVIRLSATGNSVVDATYVGGTDNDGLMSQSNDLTNNYGDQLRGDINVDDDGNIYVASVTSSSQSENFPVTFGAYKTTYGGGATDGCVFKLNSDLSDLVWCSYLGGISSDALFSIQRDSANNVYVAGGTVSSNFPTLNGLHNNSLGGNDGVVSKISADGSNLLAGTRLGTNSFDQAYFIQLDNDGDVYVLGQTRGRYSVTSGVYSNNFAGIFIHKLNAALNKTEFSTVIGSTGTSNSIRPNISPTAFLINECENIFLSGWGGGANSTINGYNGGNTNNMPLSDNAYQSTTDGADFYMMVLRHEATELIYATYFGGPNSEEHVDGGTSRFDKSGIVYQSVCAGCGGQREDFLFYVEDDKKPDNNPNTYPKWNESFNCNNGVIKFDLASLKAEIVTVDDCIPLTYTFENNSKGGVNFEWDFGDGSPGFFSETPTDVTHTFPESGPYVVRLIATDLTTCQERDTSFWNVTAHLPLEDQSYADTLCIDETKTLTVQQEPRDSTYFWSPTTKLSTPNQAETDLVKADTSRQYLITIIDTLGCVRIDTFDISVPHFLFDAWPEILGNCTGKDPALVLLHNETSSNFDTAQFSWEWELGDGSFSNEKELRYQYSIFDSITVRLSANAAHCEADTTFGFRLNPVSSPNIITPNNDDKNEFFVIEGMAGTGAWKFEVYNRWGSQMYLNNDYDNTWNANDLNDGTYFFLITSPSGVTCKNWVQVTR